MLLCPAWPCCGQAALVRLCWRPVLSSKCCTPGEGGQLGGGGWTWGLPLDGNTETNGHGHDLQRVGGLSRRSYSLCRGWDTWQECQPQAQWGGEGPPGARWALRVPCGGQEECSPEQHVEVTAGKGSCQGITQHHLRGDTRLGQVAQTREVRDRLAAGMEQDICPEQAGMGKFALSGEWPPGTKGGLRAQ